MTVIIVVVIIITNIIVVVIIITNLTMIITIPPSYGMNMVASNEISLDRSLPDTRMSECKDWHYPAELPKVDIFVLQVQN